MSLKCLERYAQELCGNMIKLQSTFSLIHDSIHAENQLVFQVQLECLVSLENVCLPCYFTSVGV